MVLGRLRALGMRSVTLATKSSFDETTVNRFRQSRGRLLASKLAEVSKLLGRKVTVLDVGGRRDYWGNVDVAHIERIVVMNNDPSELERDLPKQAYGVGFENVLGDATNLSDHGDKSWDFVHSNSVIEHVGSWNSMSAMAREVVRVGRAGWVQTPAWEFPIEPHFRAPFLHWLGQPLRRNLLVLSRPYRKKSVSERRFHVDRINLLGSAEVRYLFSGCDMYVERFALLPKSYVAHWMPSASDTDVAVETPYKRTS
jgi:hypothetical protein